MTVVANEEFPVVGRIARPWVGVSVDVMEDRRLSLSARLVFAYMVALTVRPGWTLYITHVKATLGLSDYVWVRIRRELEKFGYYQCERRRHKDGTMYWVHIVTDPPTVAAAQPGHADLAEKATIPEKLGGGAKSSTPKKLGGGVNGPTPEKIRDGKLGDIRTKKARRNKTSTTTPGTPREPALFFPQGLPEKEVVVVAKLVSELPVDLRQDVLDELIGAISTAGTIRKSATSYLRALVRRAQANEFHPSLGIQVAARRQRLQKENERRRVQDLEREKRHRHSSSDSSRAAFNEFVSICSATLGTSIENPSPCPSGTGGHQGDPGHASLRAGAHGAQSSGSSD